MSIADLRAATHEAASDVVHGEVDGEGTAEAEATSVETTSSEASSEGKSATVEEVTTTESEALEGTDAPEEYFGYKFPPDLTPEQRTEIFSELKKRDDTIGKLLRGKDETVEAKASEEVAPPEAATDAEILQALGLDPDDPFAAETAKALLPVVRRQMDQDATIAQLIEIQELNEIDRSWRSSLSGLEKEFGALPAEVTHDRVMEFAADNTIGSPVDAYWRIMGPGRQSVEASVAERTKALLAEKAKSAATRPSGSTASSEAPLESKTTKGATREAATRIMRELGLGD